MFARGDYILNKADYLSLEGYATQITEKDSFAIDLKFDPHLQLYIIYKKDSFTTKATTLNTKVTFQYSISINIKFGISLIYLQD